MDRMKFFIFILVFSQIVEGASPVSSDSVADFSLFIPEVYAYCNQGQNTPLNPTVFLRAGQSFRMEASKVLQYFDSIEKFVTERSDLILDTATKIEAESPQASQFYKEMSAELLRRFNLIPSNASSFNLPAARNMFGPESQVLVELQRLESLRSAWETAVLDQKDPEIRNGFMQHAYRDVCRMYEDYNYSANALERQVKTGFKVEIARPVARIDHRHFNNFLEIDAKKESDCLLNNYEFSIILDASPERGLNPFDDQNLIKFLLTEQRVKTKLKCQSTSKEAFLKKPLSFDSRKNLLTIFYAKESSFKLENLAPLTRLASKVVMHVSKPPPVIQTSVSYPEASELLKIFRQIAAKENKK